MMQEMQPYPGAGDNRHQSFQQPYSGGAPAWPQQPNAAGNSFSDFEAELEGNFGGTRDFDENEEYPTDSAMFFTSVDRNMRPKKPTKPPVNPAKAKAQVQHQQGFMSKLFNKDK